MRSVAVRVPYNKYTPLTIPWEKNDKKTTVPPGWSVQDYRKEVCDRPVQALVISTLGLPSILLKLL